MNEDVGGLLCYNVDLKLPAEQRSLHVISDPCSKKYRHSIGNGLWQAALELLDFFAGMHSGSRDWPRGAPCHAQSVMVLAQSCPLAFSMA
jgi:hypothetical protein